MRLTLGLCIELECFIEWYICNVFIAFSLNHTLRNKFLIYFSQKYDNFLIKTFLNPLIKKKRRHKIDFNAHKKMINSLVQHTEKSSCR